MLVAPRRKTRVLHVGDVKIGGDNPIIVQSMTTSDTRDPAATLAQITELAEAGCEIVRIAVPDRKAAAALPDIIPYSPVPLIADIHFEHTLALKALEAGIHGLRLNPGNIRKHEDVVEVVQNGQGAGDADPNRRQLRLGATDAAKSSSTRWREQNATQVELRAEWMVRTALGHIKILEDLDFSRSRSA